MGRFDSTAAESRAAEHGGADGGSADGRVAIVAGRFGRVDVLVNNAGWDRAAPFLASAGAGCLTGQTVSVSGGLTMS